MPNGSVSKEIDHVLNKWKLDFSELLNCNSENPVYKMYCSIINDRLTTWTESNGLLADEQNGFRKKRSTVDHISSLTNIIETKKKQKKGNILCVYRLQKSV